MSANRKLQSEIIQVLKKVEEGVLLFDDIWEKVYAAGQQSLKEKYEGDLKKEIKKLQRLRDQVKNWLNSSEVKDKAPLTEARKIIESKMEQFKICEKDTKTKAYSKEGLAREARTDPKEIEREEKRCWLNDCLERLGDLIDSIEVDVEKMTTVKGGKTKMKDQLEKLDNRLQKNRWHMARLEQILKLLDNEDMDPSELDGIKDDVDYYIESAAEDEGAVGVDEEFDIYEDLNLDAILVGAGGEDGIVTSLDPTGAVAGLPLSPRDSAVRVGDAPVEPESTSAITAAAAAAAAVKKPVAPVPATTPLIGKQTPPTPPAKQPVPVASLSAIKAGVPPAAPAKQAVVTPISPEKVSGSPMLTGTAGVALAPKPLTATVKALESFEVVEPNTAAVAPQSSWAAHAANASAASLPKPPAPGPPALRPVEALQPNSHTAEMNPLPVNASHLANGLASSSSVAPSGGIFPQNGLLPVLEPSQSLGISHMQTMSQQLNSSSIAQAQAAVQHRTTVGPPSQQQQQQQQQQLSAAHISAGAGSGSMHQLHQQQQQQQAIQQSQSQSHLSQQNSSFSQQQANYAASTQAQGRGGLILNSDVQFTISMLKQSALNSTEVLESDRLTGYVPRNQYNTHPSFPSQPPPVIESGALFERLPADSLFFAFYHQQGSYQQFLAAKQLKKQSWRFHKKYMTWFQRHEEPKVTSDDFEEGTYVYFDYESGWCQRIKADFKFEYNYLEDEIAQPTAN